MPVDVDVKISGLEKLQADLDKAAKQAVKNYLRSAAKDAAQIWVQAIVDSAPRDTGFLAEHIEVATRFLELGTKLTLQVGPAPQAFYASFIEFGTQFQEAQPFMRPAFEEHKEEVLQAFAEAAKVSLIE